MPASAGGGRRRKDHPLHAGQGFEISKESDHETVGKRRENIKFGLL